LIELYPGEVLLDIGSGPGLETSKLARRVDPAWAFGLDPVARMVKVASENARRMGVRNVSFLKGSVEDIPLADESVDVVVSNCVINLAMDKERAMREVLRVLRPGGRLTVADTVWLGAPSASVRESAQAWASCIGGALEADEYPGILARVGFEHPRLKVLHAADASASSGCCEPGYCGSAAGQDDDEGRAEGGTRSVCGCTLPPEAPALASALVTAEKGGFPDGAVKIRRAEPGDLGIVVRILEAAGLPVAGVQEHFGEFMVAQAPDGTITGAAGLEAHSSSALLRSVAVLPRWRGTGVGRRLVSTQLSRLASGTHVYLLTTTAEAYFRSFGFERISAEDVPEELRQSREFQGACPQSAAVMRLVLS
jgi:N-acetylglutamate synthase-like GNAT family acetyltransferase/precorrin-6B methylase 2